VNQSLGGTDAPPTVTVIITTFNRSSLVVEAIDSVFAQTFRDFELIVVNDGSTDDTRAVLDRFGDRIRCIHQPNSGLNAARNAAIDAARGKYFALLDDDDLWEPRKLEIGVKLLERFPRAFAFSNFAILRGGVRITRDGLRTWHCDVRDWSEIFPAKHTLSAADLGLEQTAAQPGAERFDVFEGDIYEASLPAPWVLPAASLVRRSAVPQGLRFNAADSTCGDWEYFARLSKAGGCVFVDTDAAVNRSHEDAVRLTRLPRPLQLSRRVAMIERVWCADAECMARSGARVSATLHECLVKLARARLLVNERAAALEALSKAARLESAGQASDGRWLRIAASIPGAGFALGKVHQLRNRLLG
jgi:glycosyltransferase involved in cell wall biosynthesis